MFESLDEHIKQDDKVETTSRERWLQWLAVLLLTIVVFGGLYFGIRMLE